MSAIKVGDLVVVNRPTECCRNPYALGFTFVVRDVVVHTGRCHHCKTRETKIVAGGHPLCDFNVSRLKRIPPLDELETTKHDEEITA
jgi:hypothetical protein